MNDPSNWVGLLSQFSYEKSLSDYIAAYPHRLEDGLLPHPDKKIRERVLNDRGRLDVLLLDRDSFPVIVRCKQHQPSVGDIDQLRRYIRRFAHEEKQKARGILVHGGLASFERKSARRRGESQLLSWCSFASE
jgi:RecB family endonuclease NucS